MFLNHILCSFGRSIDTSYQISWGNRSKSVSIKWVLYSQKIVEDGKVLRTFRRHCCQLCRKTFARNLKKLRLKTGKVKKNHFFQGKRFSWRPCRRHVITVLKIVPKNVVLYFRKVFRQSPSRISKIFVENIVFNPKCFFGHIKSKPDETAKNCHWVSEMIYFECQKKAWPHTSFQNIMSTSSFPRTKIAILTTLPNSCRQNSGSFSLNSGNGWKIGIKTTHHKRFSSKKVFWQVDCSFRNPVDKTQPKVKLKQPKYKKGKKLHSFQKMFFLENVASTWNYSFDNRAEVFQQEVKKVFFQCPERVEKC